MIVLLQRVDGASVDVVKETGVRRTGEVARGFLALVCAEPGDGAEAVRKLARKTAKLRVFEDEAGKMNRSVADVGGRVLAVSQFTLAADCMNGNRPSFSGRPVPKRDSRASTRTSRRCAPKALTSRPANSARTCAFRS